MTQRRYRLELQDGSQIPLSVISPGVIAAPGQMFGSLPRPRIQTHANPFRSGVIVDSAQWDATELQVPVHIVGSDPADLEQRMDTLARAVTTVTGTGVGHVPMWLIVSRHDGTERRLGVILTQTLAINEATAWDDVWSGVLSLLAPTPFWEGAEITYNGPGGTVQMANPGHVDSPATVTITGGLTQPLQVLAWGGTFAAGRAMIVSPLSPSPAMTTLTLDAATGTATKQGGMPATAHIGGASAWPWVQPGLTTWTLPAGSTVSIAYRPRYLTV